MTQEKTDCVVPYVFYDQDGAITQCGHMLRSFLPLQGVDVLEGAADPDTHYVKNGVIRRYTAGELRRKNTVPDGWVWQLPQRKAVDMRTLEQAQAQAWQRIKAARAVAEKKPFISGGNLFDADVDRLMPAVQMASILGAAYTVQWTLADNTHVTLDAAAMIAAGAALAARNNNIFDQARELRTAIAACLSNSDVDAVQWKEQQA